MSGLKEYPIVIKCVGEERLKERLIKETTAYLKDDVLAWVEELKKRLKERQSWASSDIYTYDLYDEVIEWIDDVLKVEKVDAEGDAVSSQAVRTDTIPHKPTQKRTVKGGDTREQNVGRLASSTEKKREEA